MHADFSSFWQFDPATSQLKPLSDGPGEQPNPVVLSTPNGAFAMGIFSPERSKKTYGRWKFVGQKVVKWNCVFRVDNPEPGTRHSFSHYVAVGTREQVRQELEMLHRASN